MKNKTCTSNIIICKTTRACTISPIKHYVMNTIPVKKLNAVVNKQKWSRAYTNHIPLSINAPAKINKAAKQNN